MQHKKLLHLKGINMKIKVKITEVLEKIIEVEANSGKEALQIADNNYRAAADGYILSGDDIVDSSMEIYTDD